MDFERGREGHKAARMPTVTHIILINKLNNKSCSIRDTLKHLIQIFIPSKETMTIDTE